MPPKLRKMPVPVARAAHEAMQRARANATQKQPPAAKPAPAVPPPPVAPPRNIISGGLGGINPAASPQRTVARETLRQMERERAQTVQSHPHPVVKPAAPPSKSMPKVPTPPQVRLQPARPTAPPPAPAGLKSLSKSPAAAAGAASAPRQSPGFAPAPVLTGAAALGALAVNLRAAPADLSADAGMLQSSLENLQSSAMLTQIQNDAAQLDAAINRVLDLLESARAKGYAYQKDLEEIAYGASSQWQTVSPQVQTAIQQKSTYLQGRVSPLAGQVQLLNNAFGNPAAAANLLRNAQSQTNLLLDEASRAATDIENLYNDIETDVYQLETRLTQIHWALDQFGQASFKLEKNEDLYMAVAARWDKEGKEDPEGILYLTNKRLIFERKEKVATKKVLFITLASEMVQEVVFAQPLNTIKTHKAANKGLFGHQDFIEVTFSDSKLGTLALHLNGQPSEKWNEWLKAAISGTLEQDRATDSGMALGDLTRTLTAADFLALQAEVNALQDDLMLKNLRTELQMLEGEVRTLERKLAGVRARGYVLEKNLEADLQVLLAQWERVETNAQAMLAYQQQQLSGQGEQIRAQLAQLMGMTANPQAARAPYIALKSAIASASAQADAAEDTVLTQFDRYAQEVQALAAHLDWVDWMLDALATATFRLLADESGVAATEAVWLRPGLEPENGILFLTDKRLLWEDRVETFECKFQTPLSAILEVRTEPDPNNQAGEYLIFSLGAGAPTASATFDLAADVGADWLHMIGRARSGDYATDRSVQMSEEDLARIRNAPTQCANCGAAYTAPLLRGQNELICEYCGVAVRL
ncbi:MAG: hypothetical protein OHK0052_04720 [Anaerolineales bacterium]